MSQTPHGPAPHLNLRGAVDLSSLSQPAGGRGGAAGSSPPASAPGPQGFTTAVVDVSEAVFGDVVQQSMSVPVVLELWSARAAASDLSAALETLATEHAGRFLLARVDVDANMQIAAAVGVQTIPTVVAVLKGQPVPLFQGALPESQVRQVIAELLKVAEANGVSGRLALADAPEEDGAEEVEEVLPPLHQEAYEAIERGDMDAAADAYRRALAQNPGDDMARAGLGQVELFRRTAGVDLAQARAAAAADATDVQAQLLAADCDMLGGHVEDAFSRLVDTVRLTAGEDRETVRARLVELFDVVGGDDPRVVAARRALASALF